ncbi:MAG: hypothetical protein ACK4UJ_07735 [Leptonema sp. (in: bacteria)]
MYDAYDPKKLSYSIFHQLHKKLSEKEDLYDDEIKYILLEILKEYLPTAEISIKENFVVKINYNNKKFLINIQNWIDSIKVLYNQYTEYLNQ